MSGGRARVAPAVGQALWVGFALLVLGYLMLPLVLVVLFSFNDSALTSLPLTGLSWRWYAELLSEPSFWPALENSAVVGAAVSILSLITGTAAALTLARLERARGAALIQLFTVPMMMPTLIVGIALLSWFLRVMGLRLGLTTVVLGQLVIVQPLVIATLYARLRTFDWAMVESARDLGASPLRAFLTITLPIIRPSLVGAALVALAVSLDDFIITFFTIGSGNTLPTMIWGMVRTSLNPTINAVATLLILVSTGAMVLALRLGRYRG